MLFTDETWYWKASQCLRLWVCTRRRVGAQVIRREDWKNFNRLKAGVPRYVFRSARESMTVIGCLWRRRKTSTG